MFTVLEQHFTMSKMQEYMIENLDGAIVLYTLTNMFSDKVD